MAQELIKYRLLNIFYNREKEIEMLRQLELKERGIIQNEDVYKAWIKQKKILIPCGMSRILLT
jgi:uncharacterized protein YqgQ